MDHGAAQRARWRDAGLREPAPHRFLPGWLLHERAEDRGSHTICAVVTAEFLEHQRQIGNDLVTPAPHYGFPGLVPGDRWCVTAVNWLRAFRDGAACFVVLSSTNEAALEIVPLAALEAPRSTCRQASMGSTVQGPSLRPEKALCVVYGAIGGALSRASSRCISASTYITIMQTWQSILAYDIAGVHISFTGASFAGQASQCVTWSYQGSSAKYCVTDKGILAFVGGGSKGSNSNFELRVEQLFVERQ